MKKKLKKKLTIISVFTGIGEFVPISLSAIHFDERRRLADIALVAISEGPVLIVKRHQNTQHKSYQSRECSLVELRIAMFDSLSIWIYSLDLIRV